MVHEFIYEFWGTKVPDDCQTRTRQAPRPAAGGPRPHWLGRATSSQCQPEWTTGRCPSCCQPLPACQTEFRPGRGETHTAKSFDSEVSDYISPWLVLVSDAPVTWQCLRVGMMVPPWPFLTGITWNFKLTVGLPLSATVWTERKLRAGLRHAR